MSFSPAHLKQHYTLIYDVDNENYALGKRGITDTISKKPGLVTLNISGSLSSLLLMHNNAFSMLIKYINTNLLG